ncbi:MAG: ThiF family adenylyltransferase [Proteobacteria bacterium]|nr:ThiF family adenylyltransferase [Pseudomonadota bacterium]
MIDLRIAESDFRLLRSALLNLGREQCAVLFAARSRGDDSQDRLCAREVVLPLPGDYSSSGVDHVELRPEFVARMAKRARLDGFALIFVHSHPGEQPPAFSRIDDVGEVELAAFLARRGQTEAHASMVLSAGGVRARVLGQEELVRVVTVGDNLTVMFDPTIADTSADARFDRQVRAFGAGGQRRLRDLQVAIVGLGGTGSLAAQQLAHLGIRSFILVDPDTIEDTNLNRVVGAQADDVGGSKVGVAQQYIERFAADARVRPVIGDVVRASVARRLADADVILCCTDSHGSRSVVQQVAYQFLIPCIDVGSTITADRGTITGIFGRVQLVGPDQPCLWCTGLLSSDQVRKDMTSEFERRADPYIQGAQEPAPSVISLNGTVVSLAVTMLLGVVTSVPVDARHLIYNARASTLRPVRGDAQPDCFICSRGGVFGRGDSQQLFARRD